MKTQISALNRFMEYPESNIAVPITPIIWMNSSNLYLKGSYGAIKYELQYSISLNEFSTQREFSDNVNSGSPVLKVDKEGWYRVIAFNSIGSSDPSNSILYS